MTAPPSKHGPSWDIQGHPRREWIERSADRLIPRGLEAHREQVLYLAVGAWNTLFGYGVFAGLYYLAGGRVSVAVVLVASYVIAVISAYVGYRYVAFRSQGSVVKEFPRFSAVYILALIANLAFLPVALRLLPLNTYAVQALFTGGVVVASYLAHRHFSFRPRAADKVPPSSSERLEYGSERAADAQDPGLGGG